MNRLKKIGISCLVLLLVFTLGYYVHASTTLPDIRLGGLPFTADYTVRNTGSAWWAIAIDGQMHEGTGLVNTIQWAHDQLTSGGTIYVQPQVDAVWETTLTISNPLITLESSFGWHDKIAFKAKASLGADMIQVTQTGTGAVLKNFGLDGNKAGSGANKGITLGPVAIVSEVTVQNVEIANTQSYGMQIWVSNSYFENIVVDYASDTGIYLTGTYGSTFVRVLSLANSAYQWFVDKDSSNNSFLSCSGNQAINGYSGWLISGYSNSFTATEARSNARHGFWLYGGRNNIFTASRSIDNSQQTNATYNGFYLSNDGTNDATRNSIQAFIDSTAPGTIAQLYGVEEADANQNRNILASGSVILHYATSAYHKHGAQSIQSSDIITA